MYRRLTLRNFRSIEEAEVTLGPFGVVVGPNSSGKSNFVDGFVFMRDLAMDASTAISSRGGISSVRRFSKSKPYEVQVTLRLATTNDALDDEYFEHSATIRSGKDGAWSFKREHIALANKWRIYREGNSVDVQKSESLQLNVEEIAPTASVMSLVRHVLLKQVPSRFRRALLGVYRYRFNPQLMQQPQVASEGERLVESGQNITSALRSASSRSDVLGPLKHIVPDLQHLRVIHAGRHMLLELEQDEANSFSAADASEGAMRALGVIVAAKQLQKHELLIIEEPEANIHVGAAQLIFDVLKQASRRGTVLITSHSPELLDAAHDEDILVCDYRDGVTRVGPLATEQRQLVKDGLFKVAELVRTEPLRIEGDQPATL